jgi:hypothetical protein
MHIEEITRECCAKLGEKTELLDHYAQITVGIKDIVESKEIIESMALHVKERQGIIDRIQSIDRELNRLIPDNGFVAERLSEKARDLIEGCLEKMRTSLEKLEEMDRECLTLATAEHGSMQSDIFQMRSGLRVARRYGRTRTKNPRFLDLRR